MHFLIDSNISWSLLLSYCRTGQPVQSTSSRSCDDAAGKLRHARSPARSADAAGRSRTIYQPADHHPHLRWFMSSDPHFANTDISSLVLQFSSTPHRWPSPVRSRTLASPHVDASRLPLLLLLLLLSSFHSPSRTLGPGSSPLSRFCQLSGSFPV